MTKIGLIAITFCLSFFEIAFASGMTKSEHYVFRYDTGATYDVQLTDNTITWTGLEGDDTGLMETDSIKRKKLSAKVEVIQWSENNGTFITLVFDRKHLRIVSSGKFLNDEWLAYGVAEVK